MDEIPVSDDNFQNAFNRTQEMYSAETFDFDYQVNQLISYIRSVDSKELLDHVAIESSLSAAASRSLALNDGMAIPPQSLRYIEGLILVYGGNGGRSVNYRDFLSHALGPMDAKTYSLLIHSSENNTADKRDRESVEYFAMMRKLTTSRYKFSRQPLIAAQRAYSPHNQYLEEINGFTIEEAITCTAITESIYAKSRQKVLEESPISPEDINMETDYFHYVTDTIQEEGVIRPYADSVIADQVADIVESVYTNSKHLRLLRFDDDILKNRVNSHDKIDMKTMMDFMSRMSSRIGTGEKVIPDSLPKFRMPFQFNPINKTPIIDMKGEYHIAIINFLRDALWRTFYYDLIRHNQYGDPSGETGGEFGNKFGQYLEKWAGDQLLKLFDQSKVFINPKYSENGDEAADILVKYPELSTLLVFECKVATFPITATPEDYQSIEDAVQEKIGEGYEQALDLISSIADSGLNTRDFGKNSLSVTMVESDDGTSIDVSGFDHYVPIVVVGDIYDILATLTLDTLLQPQTHNPYLVDILSLQIITEILNHPSRFVDYVNNRRRQMYSNTRMTALDETDYLGAYVRPIVNRGGVQGDGPYEFPKVPEDTFMPIMDQSQYLQNVLKGKYGV